mgnify:CR=1 FL=1
MPHAAGLKPRHSRVQFEPKLLTVLREGYGLADLRADMIAGLTVAIVALPLSMAIAIASGVYLIHVEVPDVGERVIKAYIAMRQVDLQNI